MGKGWGVVLRSCVGVYVCMCDSVCKAWWEITIDFCKLK